MERSTVLAPNVATLPASGGAEQVANRYLEVRRFTERLCEPLAIEDYVVQSMPDVSPTKWHLAHTSWFFETFVLRPYLRGYEPYHPAYAYLFNSYYVQAGERHCRDQRGYISRPTVQEVYAYRAHVDAALTRWLERADAGAVVNALPLIELGLNHEQQHQELLLTDIKHVLSVNPLRPEYASRPADSPRAMSPIEWLGFDEGLVEIGHAGSGFAYDNEAPRHRHYVHAFLLASRPATNGEFLEFVEDGGYSRPELWLSDGWVAREANDWRQPFYWEHRAGRWQSFTLAGPRELQPAEPVAHVTYFEADAFARWAGARLPTEQEWEVAAAAAPVEGNFVESGRFHPAPVASQQDAAAHLPAGLFGDVWEWTASQYTPYPGYRPAEGALGEYNGKFMCNQFVLRGGSCATSRSHIRATYRNFFPPAAAWQFTGLRLARDP
ncbi:MAG: ergothioneine biosynthesis protein EgtB [Longimicrobiales bacterium]